MKGTLQHKLETKQRCMKGTVADKTVAAAVTNEAQRIIIITDFATPRPQHGRLWSSKVATD